MNNKLLKRLAHDIMNSPDYNPTATIGQGYENTLVMLLPGTQLLHTLAEQQTDKRHADDQDTNDPLPNVSTPDIVAWLRSLAPLSDKQIYDTSWKD
jgi:hypothetical protein